VGDGCERVGCEMSAMWCVVLDVGVWSMGLHHSIQKINSFNRCPHGWYLQRSCVITDCTLHVGYVGGGGGGTPPEQARRHCSKLRN
jgi:hypothetical protein